jgi:hypothetical protein
MIPDSHGTWCKYDEAAAEIERLREQVATYLTCYESEQKARKRLWKRVREALGDE